MQQALSSAPDALTFRPMREEDIPALSQLAERIWRVHYTTILTPQQIDYMLQLMYSPDHLREQMTTCRFTLAHQASQLVAYASVEEQKKDEFFLHKCYVDHQRQRSGIGARLLQELIRQHQPRVLSLHVNRNNWRAINFYFSRGFTITGTKDTDIGQGFVMEDFIMQRHFPG